MSKRGIDLRLSLGQNVPVPAPPELMETLDTVEVTHNDSARSGFRITFRAGRSREKAKADFILLKSPLLKPCNRVIIEVVFGATLRILMDGIITNQQVSSSGEPGSSTLTVIGEDVSLAMDMKEKSVQHKSQDDYTIVQSIIGKYHNFGLVADIVKPPVSNKPDPAIRIPSQEGTDLRYLQKLAKPYGYVFYIIPGTQPKYNTAYWGPPKRKGTPQKILTTNMGYDSNVVSINFQYNALTPFAFEGTIIDGATNKPVDINDKASSRQPLSSNPALDSQSCLRIKRYRASKGMDSAQARAQAKGMIEESADAVNADGELDSLKYGDLLQARTIVKLGGAGNNFDGLYYVKSVTHSIKRGEYKQRFSLVREGVGAK
jgi:hypothetical protein